MPNHRFEKLQHAFDTDHVNYWSNLSRVNNLLVILKRIGRYLLMRLEMPIPFYEQRIINNMQNLYREIRTGDVLLVEGRSKLSRIIQLITKSAWSHAAIYVGDRFNDSTADGVKRMLNGLSETDRRYNLIEADAAMA